MIKINLLAEGKRPIISRKSKRIPLQVNEANAANFAFLAGVILAVLVLGIWFLVLRGRINDKQQEINVAQREVDELQQVIKEVQEYETKLAELNHKVEVITTLKDNQRGPVEIMDKVSRALPELLWLTRMDITGSRMNFSGAAFNMSAVANFIDNLDHVEAFAEPVLQNTTKARSRGRASELYNFRLSVAYDFKKLVAEQKVAAPGSSGEDDEASDDDGAAG